MIAVTGADGLIGSTVIWHLNCQGHEAIIAVDSARTLASAKYIPQLSVKNVMPHDRLSDWRLKNPDQI